MLLQLLWTAGCFTACLQKAAVQGVKHQQESPTSLSSACQFWAHVKCKARLSTVVYFLFMYYYYYYYFLIWRGLWDGWVTETSGGGEGKREKKELGREEVKLSSPPCLY